MREFTWVGTEKSLNVLFLTYYVHVCFRELSENAKSLVRPLGGSRNKRVTRSTQIQ